MAGISLGVVLAATCLTLGLGLALRQPCAAGDWSDGRQFRRLCYSDILPLYGTEHLTGDRLPYLDPCPPADNQCDEYPVGTMYFMRLAAWIGQSYTAFFYANAAMLFVCGLVTAWALHRAVGRRALFFALAPSLLVYSFVNWDLLVVALSTAATLAYLRDRDRLSGLLLGLGAAAKLYPALLVIPFALGRLRAEKRREAGTLLWWSAITYVAVNLPFAVLATDGWLRFFRFNSERGADWGSMWFVVCSRIGGSGSCTLDTEVLNALSLLAFLVLAFVLYQVRRTRDPGFDRWTFGFPLIVAFLLTNKVYSSQFGLWLLPWFALALPDIRLFVLYSITDVSVFVTLFSWFGRLAGFGGLPIAASHGAITLRAAVLVACLVAWALKREGEPAAELGRAPPLAVEPA